MDIRQYLDATYLKTAQQAGVSEEKNREIVRSYVKEAITEKFKLVMIRPDMVRMAKELIDDAKSTLRLGTVIDFPEGRSPLDAKLKEARQAIEDGVDELDFVCNYSAFQAGDVESVKQEVISGTALGLEHKRTVKWIIEVAALSTSEIIRISSLIKNCVLSNFKEDDYEHVFVKSSTGFYKTENNLPNGATVPAIMMMLENANPLPVKAAGGVRTYEEALEMIRLGVKRIGTSAAKTIADGGSSASAY